MYITVPHGGQLVGHTEPIISDDMNYYNFVGKGCLVDSVCLETFPSSAVCSSNMLIWQQPFSSF